MIDILRALLQLAGLGLIVAGVALWSLPAGLIAAGVMLVVVTVAGDLA